MLLVCIWSKFFCFLLVWGICKLYPRTLEHWPILRCLILVRHQQQANQLFSLDNYTAHVYCLKLGGRICKLYARTLEQSPIIRYLTLVSHQQANQLLSLGNYTACHGEKNGRLYKKIYISYWRTFRVNHKKLLTISSRNHPFKECGGFDSWNTRRGC